MSNTIDRTVAKTATIEINIGLNKDNLPVDIQWKSSDAPAHMPHQESKAMLLSFLDRPTKDTLKIDLWTNDMQTVEMDKLMFDTLRTLADSYFKATGNRELAEHMQQFAHYFGEKTELIKKS